MRVGATNYSFGNIYFTPIKMEKWQQEGKGECFFIFFLLGYFLNLSFFPPHTWQHVEAHRRICWLQPENRSVSSSPSVDTLKKKKKKERKRDDKLWGLASRLVISLASANAALPGPFFLCQTAASRGADGGGVWGRLTQTQQRNQQKASRPPVNHCRVTGRDGLKRQINKKKRNGNR